MVTASAMGLQMAMEVDSDSHQQMMDMPCHDNANDQQDKQHHCISCGFCVIATSIASFDQAPVFELHTLTTIKPAFFDVDFKSTNHAPAFRPPILN